MPNQQRPATCQLNTLLCTQADGTKYIDLLIDLSESDRFCVQLRGCCEICGCMLGRDTAISCLIDPSLLNLRILCFFCRL